MGTTDAHQRLLCCSHRFRPCQTMPVEEFVAGWISGETVFFLLSHPP